MRRPRAARAVPGTPRAACRRASGAMREGRIWRSGHSCLHNPGFGWYSLSIVIPIWAVLTTPAPFSRAIVPEGLRYSAVTCNQGSGLAAVALRGARSACRII